MSHAKDVKSSLLAVFAMASTALTAGGSGDATEVIGSTIDIAALAKRPTSVVFDIPCRAVLGATQTLVVVGRIQESIDGTTWTNVAADATLLTLTGGSGGTTETGVARIGVDLIRANCNYVRVRATPDLNRANTDTAVMGAGVAEFGGLESDPGN
jgi:hypothetical protein